MECRRFSKTVPVICSLFIGCLSVSKNPLSDAAAAKPDGRIVGTWYYEQPENKNHSVFLHVGQAGTVDGESKDDNFENEKAAKAAVEAYPERFKNLMRAVWIEKRPDRSVTSKSWLFFPTKIAEKHYASFPYYFGKKDGDSVYMFCQYELSGSSLTLWIDLDDDPSGGGSPAIVRAIKSGKLKGIVHSDGSYSVTDSTDNIREFLENGDANLFSDKKKLEFRRIVP